MDAAAVRRIARLAGLELDAAELERSARDLSVLLHDLHELRRRVEPGPTRDVGLEPTAAGSPLEPDRLEMPASRIAPEWRNGFFTAPHSAAARSREARE